MAAVFYNQIEGKLNEKILLKRERSRHRLKGICEELSDSALQFIDNISNDDMDYTESGYFYLTIASSKIREDALVLHFVFNRIDGCTYDCVVNDKTMVPAESLEEICHYLVSNLNWLEPYAVKNSKTIYRFPDLHF